MAPQSRENHAVSWNLLTGRKRKRKERRRERREEQRSAFSVLRQSLAICGTMLGGMSSALMGLKVVWARSSGGLDGQGPALEAPAKFGLQENTEDLS